MVARIRPVMTWLLAAALFGVAVRADAQFREPQRPQTQGVIKTIDAATSSITLAGAAESRDAAPVEKTFSLAKDIEVAVSGGGLGRGGFFREAKLADLRPGLRVQLDLGADQKTAEAIVVDSPQLRGRLTAVDASKHTVTIAISAGREREQAEEEKTLPVAAGAEIAVDEGRGRRFSIREAKLGELGAGAPVNAWLSLDGKRVEALMAEAPALFGTVKSVDAEKRTLTLVTRPARGDDAAEEKTLTVAADAGVLLDDGRGRRLSVKEAKLSEVGAGATAQVRLSTDQNTVVLLRVEGPMLFGMLKSIDADKGTIVLTIPRGRGDEPEEKTLTVAKDARITLDGTATTLGNLKAGDAGLFLQIRLRLDQKTAQMVQARQPGSR